MTTPHNKTDAYVRDTIAKDIQYHIRAMNRLLKKARAAGIRVALEVQTVVEADGRYWDVGVYGSGAGAHSALVEWASHLRAVRIKQTKE